jgi:CHAD domain-containing protein
MDIYHGRAASIMENYRMALETGGHDPVHDLRVYIKRMRAFYNLAGAVNGGFDTKARFKPYRRIAKNTGMLRDAHVQMEMLDAVERQTGIDVGEYRLFLREREREGMDMFRAFAEADDLSDKLEKAESAVRKALDEIEELLVRTNAANRFIGLRNDLLERTGEREPRPETLHETRKLAKEAHYTLEIIRDGIGFDGSFEPFLAAIKPLHQSLGAWHDCDVCIMHLAEFLESRGIPPATEPWSSLATYLAGDRQAQYESIPGVFAAFAAAVVVVGSR